MIKDQEGHTWTSDVIPAHMHNQFGNQATLVFVMSSP